MNDIVLYVNDNAYTGWLDVSVTHSIDTIASGFSLKTINSIYENEYILPILTGMACRIEYKGNPVLTGYVDDTSVELSGDQTLRTVNGRSKSSDLVDCGIERLESFKNASLETILKKLCEPFGISVLSSVASTGEKFSEFKIQPGETVFEAIDRACKMRGFILQSDTNDNLTISKVGVVLSEGRLIEGENLINVSFSTSIKERFSKYVVKGQDNSTDNIFGEKASCVGYSVTDPLVTRYRPVVISGESVVSKTIAKKRAEWECSVRRARSISVECKIPGWETGKGIWMINTLVPFESKSLGMAGNFVISSVNRIYNDNDGEITQLTLNPEGSFEPEPAEMLSKKKKDNNPFNLLPKNDSHI